MKNCKKFLTLLARFYIIIRTWYIDNVYDPIMTPYTSFKKWTMKFFRVEEFREKKKNFILEITEIFEILQITSKWYFFNTFKLIISFIPQIILRTFRFIASFSIPRRIINKFYRMTIVPLDIKLRQIYLAYIECARPFEDDTYQEDSKADDIRTFNIRRQRFNLNTLIKYILYEIIYEFLAFLLAVIIVYLVCLYYNLDYFKMLNKTWHEATQLYWMFSSENPRFTTIEQVMEDYKDTILFTLDINAAGYTLMALGGIWMPIIYLIHEIALDVPSLNYHPAFEEYDEKYAHIRFFFTFFLQVLGWISLMILIYFIGWRY